MADPPTICIMSMLRLSISRRGKYFTVINRQMGVRV